MTANHEKMVSSGRKLEIKPKTLTVGELYYVKSPEVCRVRIMEIDRKQKKVRCSLIDYADEEWLPFDELYETDATMMTIPCQAIRFSLYNLDDFIGNMDVNTEAKSLLVGKELIAEIRSNQDEYTKRYRTKPAVKAIFYDASNANKIDMNEIILRKCLKNFKLPKLQYGELNTVTISHVSDFGNIFCQLYTDELSTMDFINRTISRLTMNGIDPKYREQSNYSNDKIYLIYDESYMAWYRAALTSISYDQQRFQTFKYIDNGMTRQVNPENIYRLDLLYPILCDFPGQTILVRLSNPKSREAEMIKCIQNLLKPNDLVYMQVDDPDEVPPLVKIWKRIDDKTYDIVWLADTGW